MENYKKVLNAGFVRLVDIMGDDNRVLDSARVSTGKSSKGPEKDKALIDYLMKNRHYTPFEKIVLEFHARTPIFVARQWFRHRMGSFNEESGRYKQLSFDTFIPDVWRKQSSTNKQGSSEEIFTDEQQKQLTDILISTYQDSKDIYEMFLEAGVTRELARSVMPVGVYTEFYWTVNFRSFMNFLSLRDDEHAQYEIRQYAIAMKNLVKDVNQIPMSINAFEKFGYGG